MKKCRHCGFLNPEDIGDCLNCSYNLPMSGSERKETWNMIKEAANKRWNRVVGKAGNGISEEVKRSVKYKYHPVWFLKVKLFRLKQSFISCFWLLGVIAVVVILGLIFGKLGGK